ncbi:MAG: hypothetical protein RBS57_12835, partial [Desulforhabdus sp.]|nr:hypothetical protein [Desulforhabdus sp.]
GVVYLLHLRTRATLLLALSMRLHDLLGLHGRKFLGHELQRYQLDLPGLRRYPQLWERLRDEKGTVLWINSAL